MRGVGAVLVAVGFLWLSFDTLRADLLGRVVVSEQWQETKRWSRAAGDTTSLAMYKVGEVIGQTTVSYRHKLPNFMLPGIVMLVGAMLLARRARAPG
jgi:hypothetical protein